VPLNQQVVKSSADKPGRVPANAKADKVGNKKKKGIIFSALPLDIQNALTRGISGQDSDSDEDNTQPKPTQISSQTLRSNELIGLLPKPKNNANLESEQKDAKEKARATIEAAAKKIASTEKDTDDDDDYRHSIPFDSVLGDSDDEDNQQQTETERLLSAQWALSSASTASSSANTKSFLQAPVEAPAVPRFQPVAQLLSINSAPSIGGTSSAHNLALPTAAPNSSSYSSYPNPVAPLSQSGYDDSSADGSDLNQMSHKRKREREIEAALLSGNLDAATAAGIVKELRATNDWDESMYTATQQREAEVNASFKIGSNSAISQPTRTQSRKHQITSLAAQAAKTELAMLDAKGKRLKTKAETMSKYGW
jgi:hypothetical protein